MINSLNSKLYEHVFFYRYVAVYTWEISQIIFIIVWILIIRRFKLRGQVSAYIGFGFLFLALIFNLLKLDDLAGLSAQYVFILFTISFIQEFYHFLKHENK